MQLGATRNHRRTLVLQGFANECNTVQHHGIQQECPRSFRSLRGRTPKERGHSCPHERLLALHSSWAVRCGQDCKRSFANSLDPSTRSGFNYSRPYLHRIDRPAEARQGSHAWSGQGANRMAEPSASTGGQECPRSFRSLRGRTPKERGHSCPHERLLALHSSWAVRCGQNCKRSFANSLAPSTRLVFN